MSRAYETREMALGYLRCRPALHPLIVKKIQEDQAWNALVPRALDLGCGSGLSAAPLAGLAESVICMDPSFPMLGFCRLSAPSAGPVQGVAEYLPFSSGVFQLVTAAGSLNYSDLPKACAEIRRVLSPQGVLAIYDFSPGRSFRGSEGLDLWFDRFARRYPPARDSWLEISPERLMKEARGLELRAFRPFEMDLTYDRPAYVDYLMTETSVAAAIQEGEAEEEVRRWLRQSLEEVFPEKPQRVVFRGYIAYLIPRRDAP